MEAYYATDAASASKILRHGFSPALTPDGMGVCLLASLDAVREGLRSDTEGPEVDWVVVVATHPSIRPLRGATCFWPAYGPERLVPDHIKLITGLVG